MKKADRNEINEFINEQENNPVLFTTGAFIVPRKIDVDGKKIWFWIVESFEDDTFYNSKLCNPHEWAETKHQLLENEDLDDQ